MGYNISGKYELYIFDFFGTISLKTCPDSVLFALWSKEISEFLDIRPVILESIRESATKAVSSRSVIGEFSFNDLMENIWGRVLAYKQYNLPISYDKFYQIGKNKEIALKFNNQILNYSLLDIIFNLKTRGKKLYFCRIIIWGKIS